MRKNLRILKTNECPNCNSKEIVIYSIDTELTKTSYSIIEKDNGMIELEAQETDYLDSTNEYFELHCNACNLEYNVKLGKNFEFY